MGSTRGLATCTLAVLLGVLAYAGPASAAPAVPRHFAVTTDRTVLHSGRTFTATATANVLCSWLVDWNGERRHADARRFATTFTAPTVTRRTRITLHARCFYAVPRHQPVANKPTNKPGAPARSSAVDVQTLQVVVPPSWAHGVTITVVPAGVSLHPPHGGPPGLPNTGGPDLWVLLTGLLLLLTGAAALRLSSRADPSLPASRG